MPNISLIKDDDLALVHPSLNVVAILPQTRDIPNERHKEAKSILISNFRQTSIYFLAQSGDDVFAEIEKAEKDEPRKWLRLPAKSDTASVLQSAVVMCEGVNLLREYEERMEQRGNRPDGDEDQDEEEAPDDEVVLRVWFRRPDGVEVYTHADYSDDLLKKVSDVMTTNTPKRKEPPNGPVKVHRASRRGR